MPWFDYSVRANWFTDADCTIPTTDPAAVRYVKCLESDATEHLPNGLHVDDHGRPCKKVQAGEIYAMVSGGAVSDEKFRSIERQMMERMKRRQHIGFQPRAATGGRVMDLKSKKETEAPERIWAFAAPEIADDEGGATIVAHEDFQRGAVEYVLADRIEALELALTQSRAETAAAYERAADSVRRLEDGWYDGMSAEYHHHSPAQMKLYAIRAIRALATPDQTAALDRLIAEAEARVHDALEGPLWRLILRDEGCIDYPCLQADCECRMKLCRILAASKKGGA